MWSCLGVQRFPLDKLVSGELRVVIMNWYRYVTPQNVHSHNVNSLNVNSQNINMAKRQCGKMSTPKMSLPIMSYVHVCKEMYIVICNTESKAQQNRHLKSSLVFYGVHILLDTKETALFYTHVNCQRSEFQT